jgi:hypothetical protein
MNTSVPMRAVIRIQTALVALHDLGVSGRLSEANQRVTLEQLQRDILALDRWTKDRLVETPLPEREGRNARRVSNGTANQG